MFSAIVHCVTYIQMFSGHSPLCYLHTNVQCHSPLCYLHTNVQRPNYIQLFRGNHHCILTHKCSGPSSIVLLTYKCSGPSSIVLLTYKCSGASAIILARPLYCLHTNVLIPNYIQMFRYQIIYNYQKHGQLCYLIQISRGQIFYLNAPPKVYF